MRRTILTTIVVIFCIGLSAYGEIAVTEPSTSSFSDGKSMGGDVNYQGHFNYSIDLMTVPGRNGLSFPLNLNSGREGALTKTLPGSVGVGIYLVGI